MLGTHADVYADDEIPIAPTFDYVDRVTIPLLIDEFKKNDWDIREKDYKLGYIEMDYVCINDGSKLIFTREYPDWAAWNKNKWRVTIKMGRIVGALSEGEMVLIRSYLTALRMSRSEFIKYEDLIESDRDKIEERHEYIVNGILGDG